MSQSLVVDMGVVGQLRHGTLTRTNSRFAVAEWGWWVRPLPPHLVTALSARVHNSFGPLCRHTHPGKRQKRLARYSFTRSFPFAVTFTQKAETTRAPPADWDPFAVTFTQKAEPARAPLVHFFVSLSPTQKLSLVSRLSESISY